MTDIIHGYNARRLNTTTNFDTIFPKFRLVNGNTCAQLFTDTEFISLHSSKSMAEAGNCLNEFINDKEIPMNIQFYYASKFLGEETNP